MAIKTLREFPAEDLRGKRVFVRVDYNVPVKDGIIQDDTRVRATLPTVTYLIEKKARIILSSHLGRPKGKAVPELSLAPVANRLSHLIGKEVKFASDCYGDVAIGATENLRDSEVLLLENLRFHPDEEDNDPEFSQFLASLGEIYVNDAFGTLHRAHASVVGVPSLMNIKLAGFLVEKELKYLRKIRTDPEHPFYVILGGAKVKDKISVLQNFKEKADKIFIGGGMAYTFLKAKGVETGNSIVDRDSLISVENFIREVGENLLLPVDHVVVKEIKAGAEKRNIEGSIPLGWIGVDIGKKTIEQYLTMIDQMTEGTIFWNGPMGIFEITDFIEGTKEIAMAVSRAKDSGVTTVAGGGDTVSSLKALKISQDRFSLVSTGGGATLEFLAGIELPGIMALSS